MQRESYFIFDKMHNRISTIFTKATIFSLDEFLRSKGTIMYSKPVGKKSFSINLLLRLLSIERYIYTRSRCEAFPLCWMKYAWNQEVWWKIRWRNLFHIFHCNDSFSRDSISITGKIQETSIYIYFHLSPNNINFQKFLGNIRDTTWNSNIYNVINTLLVSPVSLYSNFISLLLFQHSTLDKIVTKHFPENRYFHRYAPLLPHRVNSDIEISIQTKCFLFRI